MKRILVDLILVAFAALAIAAAAFALRPRDDRERLISAPLFPDAPRIVPTGEGLHVAAFSPGEDSVGINVAVATGLDVEVLRIDPVPSSASDPPLLLLGAGTPAAERLRAFLDAEDIDRFKCAESADPESDDSAHLFVLNRMGPPPRKDDNPFIADARDPEVRGFLDRTRTLFEEAETDAAARNVFRAETNAFWIRYEHIPADPTYEHQSKLNEWLSRLGLVPAKTETLPVPVAWTNTPAFRLSDFNVAVVSNMPVPARWLGNPADGIGDPAGFGWLQLNAASPAAGRLRAFLEKRRPWNATGGAHATAPFYLGGFFGDGIGPTNAWQVESSGLCPDLVDLVLDIRRLLLDSPE